MAVEPDIAALTVATWKLPDHPMAEIERVSLAHQMKPWLLASLRVELGVQGLYYLSTCQRVMLSFLREGEPTEAGTEVKGALERVLALGGTAPLPTPTVYVGEEALRHMTYVATSLDSFVPGEPQVLGQFKDAYNFCVEQSLLDSSVDWVLRQVIRAAKRVRRETEFFSGKVSTIPLTLSALHEALDGGPGKSAAVVGSGKIGSKMAGLIATKFPGTNLHLVSRSEGRAVEWARRYRGTPWQLDAFLAEPPALDVVLLASDAEKPFFTVIAAARFLTESGKAGRKRLTVVDLGLPRNCTPDVAGISGCRLVQMQDLALEAERGRAKRSKAEDDARAILEEELEKIARSYRLRDLDRIVGCLKQDIVDAGKERLSKLPPALEASLASDPAFMKWYEQSLRAVAHVSMTKTRKIVEEVGGYDRD